MKQEFNWLKKTGCTYNDTNQRNGRVDVRIYLDIENNDKLSQ